MHHHSPVPALTPCTDMFPTSDIVDKFKLNPISDVVQAPHQSRSYHHSSSAHGSCSLSPCQSQPHHGEPRIPTPPPSEEAQDSESERSAPSRQARHANDKRRSATTPDATEGKGRRYFVTEDFRQRLVNWLSGHYQAREKFVFDNKAPFTGSSESLAKTFLDSLPGPGRPNTRTVFNQVKLIKDTYAEAVARNQEGALSDRPSWFGTWHAMVERGSCPPAWEEVDQARPRRRRWSEDEATAIGPSSLSREKRARTSSSDLDQPPLTARVDSLRSWAQEVQQPLPLEPPSDMAAVLEALSTVEQAQLRVLAEVRSLRTAILARS